MGNFIFGGGSKSLNKGGLLTCRGRKALPLSFTLQPQAKTVDEYSLATFSCEVTGGTAPYTYQWKKNAANVGTNSASLSFTAAAADNSASITVVVTDSAGAVITSTAVVLGVTSYGFNYDGVTQFTRLSSTISVAADENFSLKIPIKVLSGNNLNIIGVEDNFNSRISINSNGTISVRTVQRDLFNLPSGTYTNFNNNDTLTLTIAGTAATLTVGGSTYTATKVGIDTFNFTVIGKTGSVVTQRGFIYGIEMARSGVVTNNIPLNNKSQGANQLATIGSVNATIVNYNAVGWTAI